MRTQSILGLSALSTLTLFGALAGACGDPPAKSGADVAASADTTTTTVTPPTSATATADATPTATATATATPTASTPPPSPPPPMLSDEAFDDVKKKKYDMAAVKMRGSEVHKKGTRSEWTSCKFDVVASIAGKLAGSADLDCSANVSKLVNDHVYVIETKPGAAWMGAGVKSIDKLVEVPAGKEDEAVQKHREKLGVSK